MIRFPPKKILVPFDLSDVSLAAWHQAQELARHFQSSLEVLYVEEPPPVTEWGMGNRELDAELRSEVQSHIRSKIGAEAKVHTLQGDPVVTILRLARTHRPDLIVMGTHGRTGLERAWMGSVAEAVVRLSPVPVLTTHTEPKPIRSVLAPVNLTDYSEHGFFFAASLAAALKARLTVLYVTGDLLYESSLKKLIARLPDHIRKACRPDVEIQTGEPIKGILSAGGQHGLIVMVAHRKTLIKDMVLGTTVERVLRHSRIPVLSVPAPKPAVSRRKQLPAFEFHPPIL